MINTIEHSIFYFKLNGYKYIDTPWIVNDVISNITKPPTKKNFYINDKVLVASGEQSFLQLILDGNIKPGKFCTMTPCFRDEEEDDLHKHYFLKTELIDWDYIENDKFINEKLLIETINICKNFFLKYLPVKVKKMEENSYDIIDCTNGIELGSYGIRSYNNIKWIYGTCCAENRLSNVINLCKKSGYHQEIIPKYELGDAGKILEEIDEFKDALLQNNKIMVLVELSDLVGAIEFYLKKNYPNITLDDLNIMNKITQQAFINKRR
ncbi:Hypothetical protein KVN_LOCUS328 [uncultured virus]|nr:Hypothetical protein KVN_LOCUS328 [uncultured virus]